MSPSFSTTKGIASTLVHILVDRGLLSYDDRVVQHWPEFGEAGKQDITLRHVLAHQSGLYHIRQMIDRADRMLDWDYMVRAIERTPPIHEPGTCTGYHGLTYGFLVGEILQRATGKHFTELVQDELAKPLNLDGLYVGAPHEVLSRAAELVWPRSIDPRQPLPWSTRAVYWSLTHGASGAQQVLKRARVQFDVESIIDALAPRGMSTFDFGAHEVLRETIPAGNGLFTARSLAKMYAALACGGAIGGVRLLSAETLARATEVQTNAPGRVVVPFDMRWRLGYHGVATTRGIPRRAFGHFGWGGSGGWADPEHGLAVGLIVNGGMGTPFGDLRILRIGGAALASARAREATGRHHSPLARGAGELRDWAHARWPGLW
jgi:CubicO group peptidase (beta-lactamase class C family)